MKTYHGVSCAWCKEPILIPARVISLWEKITDFETHAPRSFVARCKSCISENVYTISEVRTFEGEPRTRPLKPGAVRA